MFIPQNIRNMFQQEVEIVKKEEKVRTRKTALESFLEKNKTFPNIIRVNKIHLQNLIMNNDNSIDFANELIKISRTSTKEAIDFFETYQNFLNK